MPTKKESQAAGVSTYTTPRFHRRGTPPCPDQSPTDKKYKTNPKRNTHATGVPPMVNPHFQCGMPNDPIMRNEPNLRRDPQSTFCNLQYTIPWPNPRPRCHPERRAAERPKVEGSAQSPSPDAILHKQGWNRVDEGGKDEMEASETFFDSNEGCRTEKSRKCGGCYVAMAGVLLGAWML